MKKLFIIISTILFLLVIAEAHNRDLERKFCANAPECYTLDSNGNQI